MRLHRRLEPAPAAAAAAAILAFILAVLSLWDAVRLDPLPSPGSSDSTPAGGGSVPSESPQAVSIAAAVDADPFHPERRRPGQRFRIPGPEDADPAGRGESLSGPLLLTGTLLYPGGGGAALVREGGSSTRLVRIGERIGELQLERVDRGIAVFRSPDGSDVALKTPERGD